MKRYIFKLAIIILLMGIVIAPTACEREEQMLNLESVESETGARVKSELIARNELKEVVVDIPDENLKIAIREAINKPTGELTAYDLYSMTELRAEGKGIESVIGLEYAVNLRLLYLGKIPKTLHQNFITDISSLESLTNLVELDLSYNQITDISSIKGLANLASLNLLANKDEE